MKERELNCRRYFIFSFKKHVLNDNLILSRIYTPSIRELLKDYIKLYEIISANSSNKKFEQAQNDLLNSMVFFLDNSVFKVIPNYKIDIITLIDLIKANKENLSSAERENICTKINNICNALIKKIDCDRIYPLLIERVKLCNRYKQVDQILGQIINELLYDGYSLKFLSEWFYDNINIEDINEVNIDNILNIFSEICCEKKQIKYYINLLKNNGIPEDNSFLIAPNLSLNKVDYDSITSDDLKSKLSLDQNFTIYSVEIYAMDIYKGLEIVVNKLETYFQINSFVYPSNNSIFKQNFITEIDNTFLEIRSDSSDESVLFKGTIKREKDDMKDFIKYRQNALNEQINSDCIIPLQRALNIVKSKENQSLENRFINLWNSIEFILTFQYGNNVITKAKNVIPKIVALYYIKDKINNLWWKITNSSKSHKCVNEFIEACAKNDNAEEYDLFKLTNYILEKYPELFENFNFNDMIKREISEIQMFLTETDSRKSLIFEVHRVRFKFRVFSKMDVITIS